MFTTLAIFLVPLSQLPESFSLESILYPYVHDTVGSLLKACLAVAVVELWMSSTELSRRAKKVTDEERFKEKMEGRGWWDMKGKSMFLTLGYTVYISLFIHLTMILLGAPVLQYITRTYLISLLISLLSFSVPLRYSPLSLPTTSPAILLKDPLLPIFVIINGKVGKSHRVAILAPLIGAWVSVVAIPLDWDRPWQTWPIPLVVGSWLGHCVGTVVTAFQTLVSKD